jgi:phospholipid/cholesterol/gamma-HCH transport system permease protein
MVKLPAIGQRSIRASSRVGFKELTIFLNTAADARPGGNPVLITVLRRLFLKARAEAPVSEALLTTKVVNERTELTGSGHWTAGNARALERLIDDAARRQTSGALAIDMSKVERLDTFGAWLLERIRRNAAEKGGEAKVTGLAEKFTELTKTVHDAPQALPRHPHPNVIVAALATIGRTVAHVVHSALMFAQMLGALTLAGIDALMRPHRFRLAAMVTQIDRVGWRAVPIVLLITLLIGAIVAQQGLFHFRRFGADLFVVDMVGILVLRELGVLVVCVMVAGRSGSAYTAELGAMKMREEIDALETMGFDPVRMLILPRIAALVIAVPLLTFLGSMAALYGAGLVAWLYGGIAPDIFLQRLREAVSTSHFLVGMIKAPFMALTIGIVACVEGLQVRGSSQSLGIHTTAAVVKAIFLVIVLDGLFAVFFAAINM